MEMQIVISLILLFFYIVPTLIALVRSHKNKLGITLLNIFLGWTIIGWFVALFWSLGSRKKK